MYFQCFCRVHGSILVLPEEVEVLQGPPQRGGPAGHPSLLRGLHSRERQGLYPRIYNDHTLQKNQY